MQLFSHLVQHNHNYSNHYTTSDMLSRSILSWLVLLTLATVTRSEHYHIVPVDSTDLCYDYRNGTCFTLEQLVQTDLLSGGDNLTLSFLPGDHVLTEQLLIRNFSHVQITGQNTSTAVVGFHSNGTIRFVSNTKLNIERLSFIRVNVGSQNSHQGLTIDGTKDVYIKDCYFSDFVLVNQAENHIVKITNTQTATVESTLFMSNIGRALHVEADDVYITNSEFTRNDGGAVYIKSNNALINNTEFNYNSAESGGAVEVVSGAVVITWCNFTNNKASQNGGAISVVSGSVSISNSELTNNSADYSGGAINVGSGSSVSISNSELTNNSADYSGGAINVGSGNVSISNSELTHNSAAYGGAIYVYSANVSISNSELTHNSAGYEGGAIDVYSSSVSITNSELTNNRAYYSGGATYVYSSSVSIFNSELTHNSADYRGGAIVVASGSSVSIFNSKLTKNRADYDGAIHVGSSSVSISNSELTNNSADYWGGAIYVYSSSVFISNSELTNNRADRGGAIIVDLLGSVSISNSELINNSADNGGAIYVRSGNVSISNSELTNNIANESGVIDVSRSSILIINNTDITNNMASLNISQSNVTFTGMNIVSNNGRPIYAFNSQIEFNGLTTLSNNHGVFGGAISVYQSEIYINTEGVIITNNTATSGGGIFLRESTLFVNEPIKINQNTAQIGGGIYAYSSRVEFRSVQMINEYGPNKQSEIAHNIAQNGGGIYAVSSTIELTQSYVNIDSNTANTSGGGVYLQQSSKLYLFKTYEEYMTQDRYVTLMIHNNLAEYGGGIFVADDTERSACGGGATEDDATQTIFAECFLQTINLYGYRSNYNHFNTFMTDNMATQSGVDIYGGLLDRCTVSQNAEYHISSNGLDYINNTIKSSTELSVSSRPVQVIFCNNDYSIISTRKGHTFRISVMALDQVGSNECHNSQFCYHYEWSWSSQRRTG